MATTIQELSEQNCGDLNRCNGAFTVNSKLILRAENEVLSYTVVPVEPYTKEYPHSEIDLDTYLTEEDKGIYIVYCDGQVAGQLMLSHNWNGFAYIDEIIVDAAFRRSGVGRALMQRAIEWAKSKALPGIMLETQDINVAACRFYQRCGFELGGFDRNLYRGQEPQCAEIALFWYLFFS